MQIIAEALRLPSGNAELLSVQHTPPGKLPVYVHNDFARHELLAPPGLRLWNVLLLLSSVQGGETRFPFLKLKVKLRRGSALVWPNTFVRTIFPDLRTMHYGGSVASGIVHILNVFMRSNDPS